MDQKKTVAVLAGVVAAIALFAIVYSQYASKTAVAPSAPSMMADEKAMPSGAGGGTFDMAVEPNANPATADDIVAEISAQMDAETATLSAEADAEAASISAEASSLDNLSQAYDENEY